MSTNQVNYSHLTPLSFLSRSARVFPNKDALVYRDRRWTYAEFAARINQLASALQKWGLRAGERVAFLCPNIPPMAEAHFGVPLARVGLFPYRVKRGRLKQKRLKTRYLLF